MAKSRLIHVVLLSLAATLHATAQSTDSAAGAMVFECGKRSTACYVIDDAKRRWIITTLHSIDGNRPITLTVYNQTLPLADLLTESKAVAVFPELDTICFLLSARGVTRVETELKRTAYRLSGARHIGARGQAIGNPSITIGGPAYSPANTPAHITIAHYKKAREILDKANYDQPAAETEFAVLESITIAPGYSGGPLVLDSAQDNTIAGIIEGGVVDGRRSWAIPSDLILQALKKLDDTANLYTMDSKAWPRPSIRGGAAFDDSNVLLREQIGRRQTQLITKIKASGKRLEELVDKQQDDAALEDGVREEINAVRAIFTVLQADSQSETLAKLAAASSDIAISPTTMFDYGMFQLLGLWFSKNKSRIDARTAKALEEAYVNNWTWCRRINQVMDQCVTALSWPLDPPANAPEHAKRVAREQKNATVKQAAKNLYKSLEGVTVALAEFTPFFGVGSTK